MAPQQATKGVQSSSFAAETTSAPRQPVLPKPVPTSTHDSTLLLGVSHPLPFPLADSVRGTTRLTTRVYDPIRKKTSVVQNVLIPEFHQEQRRGNRGNERDRRRRGILRRRRDDGAAGGGEDQSSISSMSSCEEADEAGASDGDSDGDSDGTSYYSSASIVAGSDENGPSSDNRTMDVDAVNRDAAHRRELSAVVEGRRAYFLQRVVRKAIYGKVWAGLVLRHRGPMPRTSDDSSGEPAAEWEITEERVAVKEMEWQLIRRLRGQIKEDPINEIRALQYLMDRREEDRRRSATGGAGEEHYALAHHVSIPLDILSNERHLFIVSPFCDGGELFDMLPGGGERFTEQEARYWMRQVLRGVQYLQANGVCHRDISLENLMVKEGTRCVVIDMGMCLRVPLERQQPPPTSSPQQDGASLMPRVGQRGLQTLQRRYMMPPQGTCGKWNYMSPEIVANQDAFDGYAVDLWSAGIVLFLMLTGFPPWDRASDTDERFRFMMQPGGMTRLLTSWGVGLSPGVMDLLQKMLRRDPRDRLTLQQVWEHPWIVAGEREERARS